VNECVIQASDTKGILFFLFGKDGHKEVVVIACIRGSFVLH
jgi:hypothetical protein